MGALFCFYVIFTLQKREKNHFFALFVAYVTKKM